MLNDTHTSTSNDDVLHNIQWIIPLDCILILWIIGGNTLVILAIIKNRCLHTNTNIFIVALAISDLCVAITIIYILLLTVGLIDYHLGYWECMLHTACLVFPVLSTILLLLGKFIILLVKNCLLKKLFVKNWRYLELGFYYKYSNGFSPDYFTKDKNSIQILEQTENTLFWNKIFMQADVWGQNMSKLAEPTCTTFKYHP